MDQQSVEGVCNLLARSRLLTPDQVRALHKLWRSEAADAADVDAFGRWLVARDFLTEYQAGLVLRGKIDHFFFGPYKLLERVGKGRMAGVYKAVHELGQVVAIKVLPPSKAKDAHLLARFQREARLAVKLKHPYVVRTFQTGVSDGLYYIVMEYLDGETLEDVLRRRGKLPPAEAVRLLHQALLGLQHIHEQGMIHRDLKPANLMLIGAEPESTQRATVKVMDIGLGKALFDDGTPPGTPGNFDLTNEGSLLGTPQYMAPEQARNAQTADVRADIYSLGCTLYHALAGRVPFPETNLVRLLMRHATEAPQPLHELNPAVPEGLQQIVDWMMAKDPAARYPTPERAAQALQVFLSARAEAPARPEPKMQAYLEWLDTQSGEADLPAAVAVPVAAPVAAEDADVIPLPEATSAQRPAKSPATKSRRPPSPPPPAKKRQPEPARPKRKARRGEDDDDDEEDDKKGGKRTERGTLTRRDWILLGVGGAVIGGGLLVAGALVYGLTRLLRPKTPPTSLEEEPPPNPAE
jgi:serine/threonine protein kinase